MKLPKIKKGKEIHTAPTSKGMGDYYGTGVKAPLGKMRGDTVGYRPLSKAKMGKPPKKLG